jgi:hypothetical protein
MIPRTHARDPHRKLALAVITQAFHDAGNPKLSPKVRNDARRFITGSPMMVQWCQVANLELDFVRDLVARYLRGQFELIPSTASGGRKAPVAVPRSGALASAGTASTAGSSS